MALVDLSADDPMVRLNHPEFDPYHVPGAHAMRMVDELLEAGQPITLTAGDGA